MVKAGRKASELAKEFGYHDTSVSAWVRQAYADELGRGRPDAQIQVSTSGYYEWRSRPPSRRCINDRIKTERICQIHAMSDSTYGQARVQA